MAVLTATTPRPVEEGAPARRARTVPVGWIASGLMIAMIAALVAVTWRRDGSFTYPLDDSYIHLRLGSNLAHGTLGMNPGEFASASSSPIWPVLIAAVVLVTGPLVGIPLVLASLTAVAVLLLVDRWVRRRGHSVGERAALMAGMVLVVPLATLAFTGMEHVLQTGAALLLAALVIERMDHQGSPEGRDRRADLAIMGAGLLCAATRPDAVFVVAPLGLLIVSRRQWRTLAALAVGSALPVLVVAVVNLGQGWPALPASVLMKAGNADQRVAAAVLLVLQTRLLLVMVLATALCWLGRHLVGAAWSRTAVWWTSVAVGASLLNVAAGLLTQLSRYEAYLIALCLVAAAVSAHELLVAWRADRWIRAMPTVARPLLAALVLSTLVFAASAVADVEDATREIHLQQVQMARFASSACPGCTVVVNDIGAVSLLGDVRIVDSFGLSNREVMRAKLDHAYDRAALAAIADEEQASFAMIYPNWKPGPPPDWERVGSWTVSDTWVLGGPEVVVYSLDPSFTDELREAFVEFDMPPEVLVTVG